MSIQTPGQRLIYMNAAKMFKKQGISVDVAVLTQSYLRTEQPFVAGQTNFTFPITVNQVPNGNFITQNLLTLQDSFLVSDLGVFLFTPASAVDTTVPLLSYPNVISFVGAAAASAESLYHGYLTLSVNKQVVVPFWDIFRSRTTNQTQQTAALGAGSPEDQLSGRDDVFYPTEPNWVLIGSRTNILQIVIPAQIATAQANARLVVYMRGLLAQNSTSVN